MLAVDTNIIVRLLMQDDVAQFQRVSALMQRAAIFIPVTVVLETEWVLRGVYRLPASQILDALRRLLALPSVQIENPSAVVQALDWFTQGMDFADALPLATAQHCDGMLTFDRAFIRDAARLGAGRVAEP